MDHRVQCSGPFQCIAVFGTLTVASTLPNASLVTQQSYPLTVLLNHATTTVNVPMCVVESVNISTAPYPPFDGSESFYVDGSQVQLAEIESTGVFEQLAISAYAVLHNGSTIDVTADTRFRTNPSYLGTSCCIIGFLCGCDHATNEIDDRTH